jgi:hypothetical protein
MTPSDTTVTAKTDKTTPGRFRQAPNHRLKRSHARSGLGANVLTFGTRRRASSGCPKPTPRLSASTRRSSSAVTISDASLARVLRGA